MALLVLRLKPDSARDLNNIVLPLRDRIDQIYRTDKPFPQQVEYYGIIIRISMTSLLYPNTLFLNRARALWSFYQWYWTIQLQNNNVKIMLLILYTNKIIPNKVIYIGYKNSSNRWFTYLFYSAATDKTLLMVYSILSPVYSTQTTNSDWFFPRSTVDWVRQMFIQAIVYAVDGAVRN